MRKGILLLFSFLFLLPLNAQQSASAEIEVSVANVDVVVQGRDGKPVTGLTAADFEVTENGERREITNFSEITRADGAATSANEPSRIVLVFDDATLNSSNKKRLIEALGRKLPNRRDEVMVASITQSLSVVQPFTRDPALIARALDTESKRTAGGTRFIAERMMVQQRLYEDLKTGEMSTAAPKLSISQALSIARRYAEDTLLNVKNTTTSLESLFSSLHGYPGRTAVIFATEALPAQPGREIFSFLEQMRNRLVGGKISSAEQEAGSISTEKLFEILTDAANANRITFYPIHATGNAAGSVTSEVGGTADADLYAALGDMRRAAEDNDMQALPRIAATTGGIATVKTNNFEAAIDRVTRELDSYYSLGFRPSSKGGARRAIAVRLVKGGDFQLRSPARLVLHHESAQDTEKILAANAVARKAAGNDLGITLSLEPITAEATGRRVPLRIHVPTKSVAMSEEGDSVSGSVSMLIMSVRKDGTLSTVNRRDRPFKVASAQMKQLTELKLGIDLVVDPSTEYVSVAVIDNQAQRSGFAVIEIPKP